MKYLTRSFNFALGTLINTPNVGRVAGEIRDHENGYYVLKEQGKRF